LIKKFLPLFCFFWFLCLAFYIFFSLTIDLPKNQDEYSFFFKESGKDLKYLISSCLNKATKSIFISSFGITDKDIVRILESKASFLPIKIAFDPKETNLLPIGKNVELFPYAKQGLMHRKMVAIDNELLLFGSTNISSLALKVHKNLIVCIRSKELYEAIMKNQVHKKKNLSFYPLPQSKELALQALFEKLDSAKERIYLCIYTFTHKEIGEALIRAKNREVDVRVYIDRGMASGTCKKLMLYLRENNVTVFTHLGSGLLHHKCALIDDAFTFGSLNWTKAAFSKNDEYLLFLDTLSRAEQKQITTFYSYVEKSSLKLSQLSDTN
jgi:phosphatidylserine/phosphatidylglycerophosphate/cardiolipin synthase-like enzyme